MKLLATARFADTVVRLAKLSQANPDGLPEVAFVGRSNAGKSSCINLICNRRRLAFSSRTPGRTQALNLFAVGPPGPLDAEGAPTARPLGFLVDTPGYGFAAAAPSAKRSWQALAGDYIRQRGPLAGVVLMIDSRRQLTDLDRQLLGWTPPDIPLIIVMTKSDKLGRQQVRQAVRAVAQDPLLANRQASLLVLPFSILSRTGVESLQQAVEALITGAAVDWTRRVADGVLVFRDPHAPVAVAAPAPADPTHTVSPAPTAILANPADPGVPIANPFEPEPAGNPK